MAELHKIQAEAERLEAAAGVIVREIAEHLARPIGQRRVLTLRAALAALGEYRRPIQRVVHRFSRMQRAGLAPPKSLRARKRQESSVEALSLVQRRLKLWSNMEDLVEIQMAPQETPLFHRIDMEDRGEMLRHQALEKATLALHRLANTVDQDPEAHDAGCFADIPAPMASFIPGLHAAHRLLLAQKRKRPFRFLDVGCGGGTKSFLAEDYFDQADGLDYDGGYVQAARTTMERLNAKRSRIMRADALTFSDYDAYDVIYFFRPIQDAEKMVQLERRICEMARPGTVLLAPYKHFMDRHRSYGAAHAEQIAYLAGKEAAEADLITAEAERMGLHIAPPGLDPDPRVGFWLPLIETALSNGHIPNRVRFIFGRTARETLELPHFGSGFSAFV